MREAIYEFMKDPLSGDRYQHVSSKKNGSKTRMFVLRGRSVKDLGVNDVLLAIKDASDQNWHGMVYIDWVIDNVVGQGPEERHFRVRAVSTDISELREFEPGEEFIKVASFKYQDQDEEE